MTRNIFYLILILSLAFTGCKQKKQEPDSLLKVSDLNDTTSFVTIENEVEVLPIPQPKEHIHFANIIEEFKYIPLEGNDDSLMGQYIIMLIHKGRIFIHDIETDQAYIFDMNGKHIKTVGKKGQGPGELFDVTAMSIDPFNDYLALYDSFQCKIFYYDLNGEFLFTRIMPLHNFANVAFVTPNRVAFGVNKATDNPQLEDLNQYNIIYTDSLLDVKGGTLQEGEKYIADYAPTSFSFNREKTGYTPVYTPDFYEFRNDTLVHAYTLDYTGHKDVFDMEKFKSLEPDLRKGYYRSSTTLLSPILFTDRFLWFKTHTKKLKDEFYTYYDKQTGKMIAYKQFGGYSDNGFLFDAVIGAYGDYFIGYVSAADLIDLKEKLEQNKIDVNPGLARVADHLNSDDNDVLVLFKLKPIL